MLFEFNRMIRGLLHYLGLFVFIRVIGGLKRNLGFIKFRINKHWKSPFLFPGFSVIFTAKFGV